MRKIRLFLIATAPLLAAGGGGDEGCGNVGLVVALIIFFGIVVLALLPPVQPKDGAQKDQK